MWEDAYEYKDYTQITEFIGIGTGIHTGNRSCPGQGSQQQMGRYRQEFQTAD
jgi:hypothetical protein